MVAEGGVDVTKGVQWKKTTTGASPLPENLFPVVGEGEKTRSGIRTGLRKNTCLFWGRGESSKICSVKNTLLERASLEERVASAKGTKGRAASGKKAQVMLEVKNSRRGVTNRGKIGKAPSFKTPPTYHAWWKGEMVSRGDQRTNNPHVCGGREGSPQGRSAYYASNECKERRAKGSRKDLSSQKHKGGKGREGGSPGVPQKTHAKVHVRSNNLLRWRKNVTAHKNP